MAGKRVALVGGAGFIGHNLALELTRQGHKVDVIDSLGVNNLLAFSNTSSEGAYRDLYWRMLNERIDLLREAKVPLHVVDAREYHKLSQVLGQLKPEVIVVLAAVSHADRSNKDPFSTFDHSFRTLENALDYAKGSVEQFIYFSSSMVYGNFVSGKVDETTVCEPLGIYGALKYGGEKLVIAYNQVFKLPYTIVRPSALYGERCVSRRVGQIFVENAMRGTKISIAGDGSDRLDFTYIDDLVQGISRTIGQPKAINEIFNITYGESRSIADMAEIIKSEFPNISVELTPRDNLMPHRGTLSVDKAKRLLGYEPKFPIDKGLVKYIGWYRRFWK